MDMSAILHLDGDDIFFDTSDELRFYVISFEDKTREYRYTTSSNHKVQHIMYYDDGWKVESGNTTYRVLPNGVLRISNGASVHWYCTIDGRASKDFTSVNTARAWGCGFLPRYRVVKVWMRVRGKGTEIGSLIMLDGRPAYHNLVNKSYYRVNVSDGKISELWA